MKKLSWDAEKAQNTMWDAKGALNSLRIRLDNAKSEIEDATRRYKELEAQFPGLVKAARIKEREFNFARADRIIANATVTLVTIPSHTPRSC